MRLRYLIMRHITTNTRITDTAELVVVVLLVEEEEEEEMEDWPPDVETVEMLPDVEAVFVLPHVSIMPTQ